MLAIAEAGSFRAAALPRWAAPQHAMTARIQRVEADPSVSSCFIAPQAGCLISLGWRAVA